jgi:hypothetical protein
VRASLAGDAIRARGQSHSVLDGPSRAYNGLEMSRLAGEGRAAWAETGRTGSVPSAQDQLQGKDTPAAWLESISGRWHRDPAGQVGSIELLGAKYPCLLAGTFGSEGNTEVRSTCAAVARSSKRGRGEN